MPSAFSRPPIRCCRPGVPGIAHGRASSLVAAVGKELRLVLAVARRRKAGVDRRQVAARPEPCHGSDEEARNVSDRRITGVR